MQHVTVGPCNIAFDYDAENDMHLAYPVFRIATMADYDAWRQAYEAYLIPLGRKVDMIFVLDMFSFVPAMRSTFLDGRDYVLSFTRYSVRVASDAHAAYSISSDNQHGHASKSFATDIPSAIAMIHAERAAALRSATAPRRVIKNM